ncbi:MAG: hypothetical protein ACM30I_13990 [Gemmatimonas sp.]
MTHIRWLAAAALALTLSAQQASADAPKMFFEGDMVLAQACVLKSRFHAGEGVVFRVRVLDPATGDQLDGSKLKSLVVALADGTKVPMKYGGHPRGGKEDTFWSTSWKVPENFPTGTFAYTIVATDQQGQEVRWQPFTVKNSMLTIED